MTIQNFNELSKAIHLNNVEKGFWDSERNMGELFMLIVSEISEALEAHRKGRFANVGLYNEALKNEIVPNEAFLKFIKDTVGDEMADVAIRLMDYCYHIGLQFDDNYIESSQMIGAVPKNFGDSLMRLSGSVYWVWMVASGYTRFTTEDQVNKVADAFAFLLSICEKFQIDLPLHIQLKMKYNATRERLHGKAY